MLNFILWILAFSLASCSNQANRQTNPTRPTEIGRTDKTELADIYARAVAEYIAAVGKMDHSGFDTLFLGKVFDFPDINLPTTIGGVQIRLLTQEAVEAKKSTYRKSAPYINLIGFVEQDSAEFIFVTFYPEFNHQYDCYLNFGYNASTKKYDLEKSRIEMLIRNKEGRADHYAVYEEGKHVGDKAIPDDKK